jgi:hypothetical protein
MSSQCQTSERLWTDWLEPDASQFPESAYPTYQSKHPKAHRPFEKEDTSEQPSEKDPQFLAEGLHRLQD